MRKLVFFLLLTATLSLALERQPNSTYHDRRLALSKVGGEYGMFLVLGASENEGPSAIYGFRQDEDFYYLTGLTQPGGAVLIIPAAEAHGDQPARTYTEILFLPPRNLVQEKWTGVKIGPMDANIKEVTGFDRVASFDRMTEEIQKVSPKGYVQVLMNKGEASDALKSWLQLAHAFPGFAQFESGDQKIGELRAIKDRGEIALIQKAADASVAAHRAAMKAMKPGVIEHSIGALMTYTYEAQGCERPAYAPIVGSGFNSTVLHYSAGPKVIQDGDIVVIDVAGEYSMYANDITRTLPANGKFTPRQREIYNVVLGAQQAAVAAFKSGVSTLGNQGENALHKVAYDYINAHGKDQKGEPLGKYFIHGLSHRVGENVHDPGPYDKPLGPGEVFTIEPGIYIPEENLGVRIEDTFYVDESGKLVNMSASLPHTAEEVEAAMKK